jgi:hypothetical protein
MIKREKVHVIVDDATIAGGSPGDIIQPVWWLSTIYDGPDMYEHTLQQFSRPQRLVRAVLIYRYEVNNGGHNQYFANSSGVTWRDAREGFQAIGLDRGANILSMAARRLGGDPSLDRGEREAQLDRYRPDFEDVDEAFGDLQAKTNIDEHIMTYIRSRPSEFYFSGVVERVVLPR